jgi:2'-5' RNA ligase
MAIRAFVAAFPTADGRDAVQRATVALREDLDGRGFRAVPPDSYHVTLRFLGDIDGDDAPVLRALLEPLADGASRISCRCTGVSVLPSVRRPRVVALDLDSGGALDALGADVHRALSERYGPADRAFLPHLTVLRSKRARRIEGRITCPELTLDLSALGLYRSDPDGPGPRYTPLFELPFAGA